MMKFPSLPDKAWLTVDESLCRILMVACLKTWCSVLSLRMPFIEPCNVLCPNDVAATKTKQTDNKILFIMPWLLQNVNTNFRYMFNAGKINSIKQEKVAAKGNY